MFLSFPKILKPASFFALVFFTLVLCSCAASAPPVTDPPSVAPAAAEILQFSKAAATSKALTREIAASQAPQNGKNIPIKNKNKAKKKDSKKYSTALAEDAAHAKIISYYGPRKSGKSSRMHRGVDIKASKGMAILAWDSGKVTYAGRRRGYGLVVDVLHKDGTLTRYAHMSRLAVKKGDMVQAGDALGGIGRTGRASTDHLHFEVHKNGKAVDPMPYLFSLGQVVSPDMLSRRATAEKSGKSAN